MKWKTIYYTHCLHKKVPISRVEWVPSWRSLVYLSVALTGLLFSVGYAQSGDATPNPYIFRMKIEGCAQAPHIRRQTGFLVEEMIGVVTVLHGIADCTTISALSADGKMRLSNMAIRAIDIDRDIAVLWSPDLDVEVLDGLQPAQRTEAELREAGLHLIGYPLGLANQESRPIESVRDIAPLNDLIPVAAQFAAFIRRDSPNIDRAVLNLDTTLQPGLAGAPILDGDGQLVGVVGGGLRERSLARSWGMPWQDIELQTIDLPEIRQRVDEVASMDLIGSFGFAGTFPQQGSDADGFVYYTVRVRDEQQRPIEAAEITLSHASGYDIRHTDDNGYYVFWLSKGLDYSASTILIEAEGYQMVSRPLVDRSDNSTANGGVDEFRLVSNQPTATATATPSPRPTSTSRPSGPLGELPLCEFAFLILDDGDGRPLARARIITTLAGRIDVGSSDALGFYNSRLPCDDPADATVQVRVNKVGYRSHSQQVALIGETKEIMLHRSVTATPTATVTPNATATATPTASPTPCERTINPYDLTARQRAGVACPAQGWVQSRIVEIQEFEGGFMIVFDDPANDNFQTVGKQRKSYLLAHDGRAWRAFFESDEIPQLRSPDPTDWYTCDPQSGVRPSESGIPWRRFGVIWCTYPQIREAFGRALTDEITTDASFQSYYRGRVFQIAGEDAVYVIYLDADDESIDERYLTGTWEAIGGSGSRREGVAPTATPRYNALLQPDVEIVCNDTKGQVWFSGTVMRNGEPVNGYRVLFKSTKVAGDTPATDPVITGPSAQHRDWAPGYYEHFVDIVASTASPKSLQIWVTDGNHRVVSANAYWETDGGSGRCNKAVINFEAP